MFPPTDFNYGPDPETATSASYTYPPQGSPYGYMPTSLVLFLTLVLPKFIYLAVVVVLHVQRHCCQCIMTHFTVQWARFLEAIQA